MYVPWRAWHVPISCKKKFQEYIEVNFGRCNSEYSIAKLN